MQLIIAEQCQCALGVIQGLGTFCWLKYAALQQDPCATKDEENGWRHQVKPCKISSAKEVKTALFVFL